MVTLYEDALQISITKLKEWNYLRPNQIKKGTISWSRNEYKRGSISIEVNTHSEKLFIELDYNFNNSSRNYKITLIIEPSNLGRGNIWYFLCPKTKKRCRKLYLINGYFVHREAFTNCMYEIQTYSQKNRKLYKALQSHFLIDSLYLELYQKNLKKTYAGKPTKKFLKLKEQIEQVENMLFIEIENTL